MSKVLGWFFFSDLYTYSFNLNNLAYHKAAGETPTGSGLTSADSLQSLQLHPSPREKRHS